MNSQSAFTWPAGQRCAVSLTYDDALPVQREIVAPLLAERGLAATFYLDASPGFTDHAEAWRAVAVAEGSLVVAVFDGLRRPPTKVGRRFWEELPVSGDSGARSLLAARAACVVEVACRGNPADIDTVEDLQLWN